MARLYLLALVVLFCTPDSIAAQFDTRWRKASPDATWSTSNNKLPISGRQGFNRGHLRIDGDLTFTPTAPGSTAGAELLVEDAFVEIRGDLRLPPTSELTFRNCIVMLATSYTQEFNIYWEGGTLTTERSRIGGSPHGYVNFWLNRGLWLASDTTVQHSGGILLGYNREGFEGKPHLRGGTLRAKGLYMGTQPDFLHLTGWGEAFLEQSTFNVALYIYTDGPKPVNTRLNLDSTNPIDSSYGDRASFPTAASDLKGTPGHLVLKNTRVPTWSVTAFNMSNGGQPARFVMDNAEHVFLNFHGHDVTGSPVLAGHNWGPQPPGLPSVMGPGHHPMPSGSTVTLANATFEAGSTPLRALAWGVYMTGGATRIQIKGSAHIAELSVDDGQIDLEGTRDYNMLIAANQLTCHGAGILNVKHASIGEFGPYRSLPSQVVAYGNSTCTMEDVRFSDLRLATGWDKVTKNTQWLNVNQGSITVNRLVSTGQLRVDQTGNGSIDVKAAPGCSGLQNLDLEAFTGQTPDHWCVTGSVTTSPSALVPTSSPGQTSLRFQTAGGSHALYKSLRLQEGATVELFGKVRATTGAAQLQVLGVGSTNSHSISSVGSGSWALLQAPQYVAGAIETGQELAIRNSGNAATDVFIDDLRVHVSTWWENNNLYNLDFDQAGYRLRTQAPDLWIAPDGWSVYEADCRDSAPRPGEPTSNRTMELTNRDLQGSIRKQLEYLQPGDKVSISGYMRGVKASSASVCWIKCLVFDNTSGLLHPASQPKVGSKEEVYFIADGNWHPFTVGPHVVPPRSNPRTIGEFTVILFDCYGGAGNRLYVDDLKVTVE